MPNKKRARQLLIKSIVKILGIDAMQVSHTERLTSALGGFVSILGILIISNYFLDSRDTGLIVASMGASAVLLFAVPHGQMSQPWAVFGGHIISAIIGVTCAQLIPHEILAASLAVGLSIATMYYLKCIHPPGGATALSAVLSAETVQVLGYQYVITPVLLNVLTILGIAIVFNYFFPWRRYPFYFYQKKQLAEPEVIETAEISHGDFVYALSQVDSFIDVSEYDLLHIYELATNRSRSRRLKIKKLVCGNYYSNGEYGEDWSVRQVLHETGADTESQDLLSYKTVAGKGRRTSGTISRSDFLQWARYEVIRDEENWKRINPDQEKHLMLKKASQNNIR